MNARSSLIPTSTEAGYGSTPAALNASKKQSTTTRSRVVAAVAGVCGVVGVFALRASGVASFAAEGDALTFDKVLSAQVRTRPDRAHGSSASSRATYTLASSRQIRGSRRAPPPRNARGRLGAERGEAEARPRARAVARRRRGAAPPAGPSTPAQPPGRDATSHPLFFFNTQTDRVTGSRTIFGPDVSFFCTPLCFRTHRFESNDA